MRLYTGPGGGGVGSTSVPIFQGFAQLDGLHCITDYLLPFRVHKGFFALFLVQLRFKDKAVCIDGCEAHTSMTFHSFPMELLLNCWNLCDARSTVLFLPRFHYLLLEVSYNQGYIVLFSYVFSDQ